MSKEKAQDLLANYSTEDGYLEEIIPDNSGDECDPTDKIDQIILRAPLSFNQGGNWYRRTVNRREGQRYFKPLGEKLISDTKHTDP